MKNLRYATLGHVGFWALISAVGAFACGSTFSNDCKASRTCTQSEGGTGGNAAGDAGMPSGGASVGSAGSLDAAGAAGSPQTEGEGMAGEGGAAGEGATGVTNAAPRVVSVSPTDAQANVETDGVITVTFSEPLAEASVGSATVRLRRNGKEVAGTAAYADAVVTFTPEEPLALLGDYELSVTTGVTDVDGKALAEEFQSSFVVRDGQFHVATAVDEGARYVARSVPVEAKGAVLLAWTDAGEGDDCPVLYQRFLRGVAIGVPYELSQEGATTCGIPTAAASPSGVSAIAWPQYNALRTTHVRQFRNDEWLPDITFTGSPGAETVHLGIAEQGTLALFEDRVELIRARRTDTGGEWSSTGDDVLEAEASSSPISIAFDAAGNGLAVWSSMQGNSEQVLASRYKAASGQWAKASLVPGSKVTSARTSADRPPALALDSSGNAVALWVSVDGAGAAKLLTSQYSLAAGWSKAAPIGTSWGGAPGTDAPALVFDGETFVAAFTANQGSKLQTLVTRLDIASGEWSAPEKRQAAQDDSSAAFMPKLATDGRGNLILAWFSGITPNFRPNYQRYSNGAWGSTQPLSRTGTSQEPYLWSLSSNEAGLAAITWTDWDGTSQGGRTVYLASFY